MRYYSDYNRKSRLIAAGVIAVGCLSFAGYNLYQVMQDKAAVDQKTSLGYMEFSNEDFEKELKNKSSDIDGLSQYDKLQKGLQITDGSDSDYDGLSDKDEIEIYGSDPLKASSSGDLYTDGYKIANGMDLTKKYDYEGEKNFPNNKCEEIKLNADDALDFYASVSDVTDTADVSSFGIDNLYKAYKIYNYSGTLSINAKSIKENLPENINLKDMQIKVFNGAFLGKDLGKLDKVSFKEEAKKITLDYTFEGKGTYYILISKKTTFASAIGSLIGKSSSDKENEEGIGLVITQPIVGNITKFKDGTQFLYSEMSDPDSTYAFRDAYINKLNQEWFKTHEDPIVTKDNKNLTTESKKSIKLKYEFLRKWLAPFEYTDKQHWYHAILMYSLYDYNSGTVVAANGISGDNGDKTERLNFNNYHTSFDQYTDELCFQNFQSDYGTEGNCLGIAHFTSYLFNTGSYPSTGSYNDISWDLGTDEENKTLMDRGIFDYKNIHFIDERTEKGSDYLSDDVLSSGEKEFVKMIGAGFQEGNDLIDTDSHVKVNGELNDYSMLKKAMDYLDAGKVVNVCLILNNGTGHAITLYDYYWVNDEAVNFRVYDSNIPQNDRENYYIHANGASYLQCEVVNQPNGEKDFQYIYYPLENNTAYMASSYSYIMQKNCMIIVDENWNEFK